MPKPPGRLTAARLSLPDGTQHADPTGALDRARAVHRRESVHRAAPGAVTRPRLAIPAESIQGLSRRKHLDSADRAVSLRARDSGGHLAAVRTVSLPARLHEIRLQGLALDILVGSVVVGMALAIVGTLLTYWGSRGRRDDPEEAALVAAAAERYLSAGITSWEFARAKLRNDPAVPAGVKDGRLPQRGKLIDLGCGQGLMLSH